MLSKISISRAMQLGFGITISMVIALGIYLILVISNVRDQFDTLVTENLQIQSTLSDLRYYTVTYRRFALDYGLTNSQDEHKNIQKTIDENDQKVAKSLELIKSIAYIPTVNSFIPTFEQRINDYREMQNHYISLIDHGQIDKARAEMLGPMLAPFNTIVSSLTQLQQELVAQGIKVKDEESAAMNQAIYIEAAVGLVVLIFLISFGISLTRKVNQPLGQLIAQMQKVEKGDLRTRLTLTDFADDELGKAAASFDQMQQGIYRLAQDVQKNAKTLDQTSIDLLERVSHTTQRLKEQKSEISTVASAMTQMQAGFAEVAHHTVSAAEGAKDARSHAANSRQVIQESLNQTEALSGAIGEASRVIEGLKKDSAGIGMISQVIRNITDQTNLLALNAAIESARAGEAGRGFAVVANEIRTLAQKTQVSIDEINQTIEVLQAHAEQAVKVMDISQSQMDSGLEKVRSSHDSIGNVLNSTTTIDDMSQMIAAATEQQSDVAKELTHSIHEINQVSEEVNQDIRETERLSESLKAASISLNEVSRRFQLA
ncbi:methyl-accepting chemotaxis protein [Marinomonas sp. A3A]|uniref:methyl-accepting chemotaxis protein n=1 Tax=Marinomonas sp. A3A TaxID=2065312 RepID=UPI001BB38FAE|nr:HAMP domain-containing methyl-accepting chemotaxis protein [Marinomonas sp. A3A]QUX90665.1 methyl-accepting chemotaxis protein [Marinomonas sp. A3A]